jgi:hypothetical protein
MSGFDSALLTEQIDDRHAWVRRPLIYTSHLLGGPIVVPGGFLKTGGREAEWVTDFNSIPRPAWLIIPKRGKHDRAGVVHDAGYQARLLTLDGARIRLTRRQVDALFLEALEACGVSKPIRNVMYKTVRAKARGAYEKGQHNAGVEFNDIIAA